MVMEVLSEVRVYGCHGASGRPPEGRTSYEAVLQGVHEGRRRCGDESAE
jgi:hypothetical protein